MVMQTSIVMLAIAGATGGTFQPDRGTAAHDFRSADKWIESRKVVSPSGEEIAKSSDAVVDRGTGRIEFLVVKTGTVLGLGGKAIAVPYSSFSWDNSGDRFVLATTADQLKSLPEFSAKEWSAMMESKEDKSSAFNDQFTLNPADPYAGSIDEAKTARAEGEVTRVERIRTSNFGEHTIIHVKAKDGGVQRIALGPSWFITGGLASPARGDQVVVETIALQREPDQLVVARQVKLNGQDMRLRDKGGSPAWALKSIESGKSTYNTRYWRYVLSSTLRGMRVDCRGEECGKVNDLIVERGSGEVAFLSIDPNQNFLGISDTKRLVPWSICSVGLDGTVRIDASKDMIVSSPETPAEVADLSKTGRADAVYSAYQISAPKFTPATPTPMTGAIRDDGWGARGVVITSIEPGEGRKLRGKIVDVSEVKFDSGLQPASSITIRDGSKDSVVLLGPSWYMNRQNLQFKEGDEVELEVARTRINGTSYDLARSLSRDGRRTVFIESGKPAWETRK